MISIKSLFQKISIAEEMTISGGAIAGSTPEDLAVSETERVRYTKTNLIPSRKKIYVPPEVEKLPSREKNNSKSVRDMLIQKFSGINFNNM